MIAKKTIAANGETIDQFDDMWISSLCGRTDKGKPDIGLVDMTSRFRTNLIHIIINNSFHETVGKNAYSN